MEWLRPPGNEGTGAQGTNDQSPGDNGEADERSGRPAMNAMTMKLIDNQSNWRCGDAAMTMKLMDDQGDRR
jgi:hypothetical protein